MRENVIQTKSYQFSLKIITTYKSLVENNKEYVLAKQLLRSGTSIGANIEEAIGGQSDRDFLSKISIAYKEARETHYWLRLLRDSGFLLPENAALLLNECDEILKILSSILKTIKSKHQ
jgi:four helix bundle protein